LFANSKVVAARLNNIINLRSGVGLFSFAARLKSFAACVNKKSAFELSCSHIQKDFRCAVAQIPGLQLFCLQIPKVFAARLAKIQSI
jgi:hypothetical protein